MNYGISSTIAVIVASISVLSWAAAVVTASNDDHHNHSWHLNPPLEFDFYNHTCPNLSEIVSERVANYTAQDPTTPSPLLRVFFHDCFVQGCDASALLNSFPNDTAAEKDSDINFSLDGFDIIDDIKEHVEHHCPGVVSCSDILALTAVHSIHQAGGPLYEIELGRRDGLTSYNASASIFIPMATLDVDGLLQNFEIVGLDVVDLVALSGAHTIGQGHCRSIADRLYPNVDSAYKGGLGERLLYNCTNGGQLTAPHFDEEVQYFMDSLTALTFDNGYFKGLQQGLGVFTSDKVLYEDERTHGLVDVFANNQTTFFHQFGISLRKMGKIGVLTGTQGQIRAKCWIRNSMNADPSLDPPL